MNGERSRIKPLRKREGAVTALIREPESLSDMNDEVSSAESNSSDFAGFRLFQLLTFRKESEHFSCGDINNKKENSR